VSDTGPMGLVFSIYMVGPNHNMHTCTFLSLEYETFYKLEHSSISWPHPHPGGFSCHRDVVHHKTLHP